MCVCEFAQKFWVPGPGKKKGKFVCLFSLGNIRFSKCAQVCNLTHYFFFGLRIHDVGPRIHDVRDWKGLLLVFIVRESLK